MPRCRSRLKEFGDETQTLETTDAGNIRTAKPMPEQRCCGCLQCPSRKLLRQHDNAPCVASWISITNPQTNQSRRAAKSRRAAFAGVRLIGYAKRYHVNSKSDDRSEHQNRKMRANPELRNSTKEDNFLVYVVLCCVQRRGYRYEGFHRLNRWMMNVSVGASWREFG